MELDFPFRNGVRIVLLYGLVDVKAINGLGWSSYVLVSTALLCCCSPGHDECMVLIGCAASFERSLQLTMSPFYL